MVADQANRQEEADAKPLDVFIVDDVDLARPMMVMPTMIMPGCRRPAAPLHDEGQYGEADR
jgi:hypothetical protein